MIRSLRWRLQLWHASVLTTVLIIFGVVVYALLWQTRLQQTDAELDNIGKVLMSRTRGLFPGPPPRFPGRPGPGRPDDARPEPGPAPLAADATNKPLPNQTTQTGSPQVDNEKRAETNPVTKSLNEAGGATTRNLDRVASSTVENQRNDSEEPRRRFDRGILRDGPREPREFSRDGTPRDMMREEPRDGPRDGRDGPPPRPPLGLGLPEEFKHLFERDEEKEGDDEKIFYYIIWDQNGGVLAHSKPVGSNTFPALKTGEDRLPTQIARTRDGNREVIQAFNAFRRGDINVQVGRSLKSDLNAVYRSGFLLGLTGLGVLVIGLAGGWWFSSRAIRPIAEMTATAESISIKNLSKRINVESTVTELEQLAIVLNHTFDRLQSAFERQSQFTADASHELRTPLAVILSHAELALSRTRSPEDYQAAFKTCRKASLRMKSLIDSLLLLARFDSVEPELDRQQVDLDRMAQEATEMLQPLAAERHITLGCQADPVSVCADRERLFQVITNLLSNAIRYNRSEGRVDFSVTTNDQTAIIRVSDTGVGISAEDLPRIFDRFYRVDKARSQAEGGCGLGLSICQTIVEAHHGTISATSELGVGTTIEVRLPISNLDEDPAYTPTSR